MALDYPLNTVWYVRATSANGLTQSEGTAVAIRLQCQGNPKTAKTYLLTCAHVVRGVSAEKVKGFGPILTNIRAWPPDTGFNDSEAKIAKICLQVKDLPPGDVPAGARGNAADDWMVLEIADEQSAMAAPAASTWIDGQPHESFRIYGYPGGSNSFLRAIVSPTSTPDAFEFRDEFQGAVRLTGDGARPGCSGGGVFSVGTKCFVGIHRARDDSTLQLHALSARCIRDRLRELGFEVVIAQSPHSLSTGPRIELATLSASDLQCIAATFLTTPESDCKAGRSLDIKLGAGRCLTVILSQFAADSMQRLALKGSLDVLQMQQAAIHEMEKNRAVAPVSPIAFGVLIQQKTADSLTTIEEIRDHIALVVDEFRIAADC